MRVNVEASVKRGAALLDARDPNWAKDLGPIYSPEFEQAQRAGEVNENDPAVQAIRSSAEKFQALIGNEAFYRLQPHEADVVRYKKPEHPDFLAVLLGIANPLDGVEGEVLDGPYYGFDTGFEVAVFGIPTHTATDDQIRAADEAAENGQKYCPVRHGFELQEFWTNEIAARQAVKEVAA